MAKKFFPEGFILATLGVILLTGISVGVIRHSRKGEVVLEILEPEAAKQVNINKADPEELILLPGIGPTLASRIVKYREEHGDFLDAESLCNVQGIGPAKLAVIKPFLEVP
ncbi:helix-hairpin-helix domain-containing protein [candidate division WOR-3 bacterium]|nr:helix-hairpin-helix domain-containing protein [candidate division WOR-3 bacterium]